MNSPKPTKTMKPYKDLKINDWANAALFDCGFEYMGWQFDIPLKEIPTSIDHYTLCVTYNLEQNKVIFTAYFYRSYPDERKDVHFSVIEMGSIVTEFELRICPKLWKKNVGTKERLEFAQTESFLKLLYNYCSEHWQIQNPVGKSLTIQTA